MRYQVQKDGTTNAYMQLYTAIRNDITNGIFTYGMKLPSKRVLASDTGVSVITVEHAYQILLEEGYIETRQRSGYYVCYKEKDLYGSSSLTVVPKVNHTPQEEEFSFDAYAKKVRYVLSEYRDSLFEKSPNQGVEVLRQAISNYLARSRGVLAKPDQIVVGAGAEYLYSLIVQMLGSHRIFGVESPSYEQIQKVYRANGVRLDFLKMGNEGIQTSELERTPASVLHVTPYHSFPTGITATASKRQEYIRWANDHDAYIVEDDYDSEFSSLKKTEDTLFSLDCHHVIYVNTFTQTISPSIRISYMVLPENLMKEFEKNIGFYSCTVPVLSQYVIAELLNQGDFERHINRVRRKRRQSQE